MRRGSSESDRAGVDDCRRVATAFRALDCTAEGGVDRLVAAMGLALDGVAAVQAQSPDHQFGHGLVARG